MIEISHFMLFINTKMEIACGMWWWDDERSTYLSVSVVQFFLFFLFFFVMTSYFPLILFVFRLSFSISIYIHVEYEIGSVSPTPRRHARKSLFKVVHYIITRSGASVGHFTKHNVKCTRITESRMVHLLVVMNY